MVYATRGNKCMDKATTAFREVENFQVDANHTHASIHFIHACVLRYLQNVPPGA
jgi:hypothetical protein